MVLASYGPVVFLFLFAIGLSYYHITQENEIWWARHGLTSSVISNLWIQIVTLFVTYFWGKIISALAREIPGRRRKAGVLARSILVAAIIGIAFLASCMEYRVHERLGEAKENEE